MRIKCVGIVKRPVWLRNTADGQKKDASFLLQLKDDLSGTEKEFCLDDYLKKVSWKSASSKRQESLEKTMPAEINITPDGIVNYVDFAEWIEDAEEYYKRLVFPLGFLFRLAELIY